jgi:hypothetical protein
MASRRREMKTAQPYRTELFEVRSKLSNAKKRGLKIIIIHTLNSCMLENFARASRPEVIFPFCPLSRKEKKWHPCGLRDSNESVLVEECAVVWVSNIALATDC